jgi:hypothetical protein
MGAVPLKRVGGLAKAAMILVALVAAFGLIGIFSGWAVRDDAEAFLDGEMSRGDFVDAAAPYGLVTVVQGAAVLAAAVVTIIWMYRIAANHRTLHRTGRWGPGWAIGGWFLLPAVNIIPFLMFRELWKASDPSVPVGGDWRSGSVSPTVTAWFVVYGPVSLVVQVLSFGSGFNLGGTEEQLAQQIVDSQSTAVLAGVVNVVAAVLFVSMARGLSRRHMTLTGER